MDIAIKKARVKDVDECLNCIKNSSLWDAYFANNRNPNMMKEAIKRKEIFGAYNKNDICIGIMGVVEKGCFGSFNYLSLLSVKSRYRNKGIGKMFLNKFEQNGFTNSDRVFVLCSDFNKDAQRFYMKNGYQECGKIRSLFKIGIDEHMFVKYKSLANFKR